MPLKPATPLPGPEFGGGGNRRRAEADALAFDLGFSGFDRREGRRRVRRAHQAVAGDGHGARSAPANASAEPVICGSGQPGGRGRLRSVETPEPPSTPHNGLRDQSLRAGVARQPLVGFGRRHAHARADVDEPPMLALRRGAAPAGTRRTDGRNSTGDGQASRKSPPKETITSASSNRRPELWSRP